MSLNSAPVLSMLRQFSELVEKGILSSHEKVLLQEFLLESALNLEETSSLLVKNIVSLIKTLKTSQTNETLPEFKELVKVIRQRDRSLVSRELLSRQSTQERELYELHHMKAYISELLASGVLTADEFDLLLLLKDCVDVENGKFHVKNCSPIQENSNEVSRIILRIISGETALESGIDELKLIVERRESHCFEELMAELEALYAIFSFDSAKCIRISQRVLYPLCVYIDIDLQGIGCRPSILFLVYKGYPTRKLVAIPYIPFPYNRHITAASHKALSDNIKAAIEETLGEIAMFQVIEAVKEWVEEHLEEMTTAVETSRKKSSSVLDSVINRDTACYDYGAIEEIVNKLVKEANETSPAKLADEDILLLLRKNRWDSAAVPETASADAPPQPQLQKESSVEGVRQLLLHIFQVERDMFTCNACLTEFYCYNDGIAPLCGHWMCLECWAVYFKSAVSTRSLSFTCSDSSCSETLSDAIAKAMLQPGLYYKYKRWILEDCATAKQFLWCNANGSDCEGFFKTNQAMSLHFLSCWSIVVYCEQCHVVKCPLCGLKDGHWPATCQQHAEGMEKIFSKKLETFLEENKGKVISYGKRCPECETYWGMSMRK